MRRGVLKNQPLYFTFTRKKALLAVPSPGITVKVMVSSALRVALPAVGVRLSRL
ncbi:MAG: hypothetical protein ILM98_16230 [Kiritimatiellae bacterium]|nr:hypothetical protein [Kiritimatiellia bacterium]